MADPNNSIVGTSGGNTSSGQPQNTEVGTGNVAAPGNPVVGGPPNPGAPVVPVGFVPLPRSKTNALKHPMTVQEDHAPGVVTELQALASQPYFQAEQAEGLPSPVQVCNALTVADAWTDETNNAKAYTVYAGNQRATYWDTALTAVEKFEPVLDVYLTAHPEQAANLKATQAFISARVAPAKKAAATRNAPKTTQARATKLTKQAAAATAEANAEASAAALRHGTGDATIVSPAPAAPASGSTPTSGNGGTSTT